MARQIEQLSDLTVKRVKKPGYHADGAGLWLQVSASGTKSWIFRFMLNGRAREMGLGPLHTVGLADARRKAAQCRQQVLDGIDPIEARKAARAAQQAAEAKRFTFDECAARYIDAHQAGWKNVKHVEQWRNTLNTYVSPVFGAIPVADVDTGLVMQALEPIWRTKTETASRLRGRIEAVLDWATVRAFRTGDNPARWKGHLDKLLPARAKVAKVRHHPALPYAEIGSFFSDLRQQEGVSALALEFAILTAARTSEVLGARWAEFDLNENVWCVPALRTKAKREHRVPLSVRAIAILKGLAPLRGEGDFVFPGRREGSGLSNMALLALLERMDRSDLTVHGFRSTFRDWCAEATAYPREVAEMALAHAVESKVEAAYRRGDLFEKRRRLMQDWQSFCDAPSARSAADIVPIRGNTAA